MSFFGYTCSTRKAEGILGLVKKDGETKRESGGVGMDFLKDGDIRTFLLILEENLYPMKPCNEDEILKLKKLMPTKELPLTYLEFMCKAGNGIEFLAGTHYSMKYILELKEWAVELLDENNFPKKLTDNQFVFMIHQGYMFWYFNLDEVITHLCIIMMKVWI